MGNTKLIISTERGYPTAYNGKKHYGITFDTIAIRSAIEPELGKMKTGLTYSLPDGYVFRLTKGLDKTVAKVCKTMTEDKPDQPDFQLVVDEWIKAEPMLGYARQSMIYAMGHVWTFHVLPVKEENKQLREALEISERDLTLVIMERDEFWSELSKKGEPINSELLEALKKCDNTFGLIDKLIHTLHSATPADLDKLVNEIDIDLPLIQASIRDTVQRAESTPLPIQKVNEEENERSGGWFERSKADFEKMQSESTPLEPVRFKCPECKKDIQFGLSEETKTAIKNSSLFQKVEPVKSEWISVKDRLPDSAKPVWCFESPNHQFSGIYTKGHEIEYADDDYDGEYDAEEDRRGCLLLKTGWYEEVEQIRSEYDFNWITREVTHWRPLLSPPIE
jgi:phage FluMu protein Com